MITSEKPQGSSGQITTDDIFPTRDPPQNHLGAFYKQTGLGLGLQGHVRDT